MEVEVDKADSGLKGAIKKVNELIDKQKGKKENSWKILI